MVLIFKIVINLIRELNAVFHYPAGHVMLGIRDLVEISFFIDAWDFVNIFPIKIYALSIASHFLETRYVATFYWIVLDIFLSNRLVCFEKLLAHPSESSEKDGMQEQSPYDASVSSALCCDWLCSIALILVPSRAGFKVFGLKITSFFKIQNILKVC